MRAAAVVVAAMLGASFDAASAHAVSPVRACIRGECRPAGNECAEAFRAAKGPALEACGPGRRKKDPCRKAVRRFVRDGVQDCRTAARACAGCCRTSGAACPVAVCGNGRIEAGEACDGGARGACAAACRADCTCEPVTPAPVCGNGDVEQGEQCDGGDATACPERCRADCTCGPEPPCGNGAVDDGEECDGSDDGDCPGGCGDDCTCAPPVCGDGIRYAEEDCEPAGDDGSCPGLCLPDCRCAECGDGVVEPPVEECEHTADPVCSAVCSEVSCDCVSWTTDDCAAPRRLGPLPAVDRQVTIRATTAPDDPLVACISTPVTGGQSVWYVVTAPALGRVRADTNGSSYDTMLVAHTGTCGTLTAVACNDDGENGVEALIDFPVTAGADYLLEATTYPNRSAGELRLEVSFRPCGDGVLDAGEDCEPGLAETCDGVCAAECICMALPADECAGAPDVALPVDVQVAASAATGNAADPAISCNVQPVDPPPSVWFRFVAPQAGTVVVDTTGSDYDTVVGVFTGACDGLAEVDCSDDFGDGLASQVAVEASAGVQYTVVVTPYFQMPAGRLRMSIAYADQ